MYEIAIFAIVINMIDIPNSVVPIGDTPIPNKEGEFLHLDIFYAKKLMFLTCIV